MDTITTKQLRENMPEVIRMLRNGTPVRLTYRHKTVGTIQPEQKDTKHLRPGSPEAIRRGLDALKDLHVPDKLRNDPRSFKEQMAELRARDLDRKY